VSVYDKIGEFLLTLRFKYGVEEFSDTSELANRLAQLAPGEDAAAILSLPGKPRPHLVSAYKEGEALALAPVDLDDVRAAGLRVELGALEDVTSRIGAEAFGDRGIAPFFLPHNGEGGTGILRPGDQGGPRRRYRRRNRPAHRNLRMGGR